LSDWRALDLDTINTLADDLDVAARAELGAAGVPDERLVFEWRLNLVYPGQTFDNALPLQREPGAPITAAAVEATVEEFHRRNEEARLIEARSQEPMVRGIRLIATGLVDQPTRIELDPTDEAPELVARRRAHLGGDWHDAPIYDGLALRPGPSVTGPALVAFPFTTLTLRPGDVAHVQPNGDLLVDVA
jgi:N-methylhydantoinase A/oxoprolinase/acetone carboxylase beta subunit